MSYALTIGEAQIEADPEFGHVGITVDRLVLPDAPMNSSNNRSNTILPAYLVWDNFCTQTGMQDLFYDDDTGLLRPHPGVKLLTGDHLAAFKAATIPPDDEWSRKRIEWLIWWTEWALANCKVPVFENR
jgi:hypothetical protein